MNTVVTEICIFILLLCLTFFSGFWLEHERWVDASTNDKQLYEARIETVSLANHKLEQDAVNAKTTYVQGINSISDYYTNNPIIKLQEHTIYTKQPNGQVMPETLDCTERVDAASSVEYVSPYNPEEVERIALQLTQLQELLKQEGAIIK